MGIPFPSSEMFIDPSRERMAFGTETLQSQLETAKHIESESILVLVRFSPLSPSPESSPESPEKPTSTPRTQTYADHPLADIYLGYPLHVCSVHLQLQ